MTRKKFIKLLMSQGYDRNGAYAMAELVRAKNLPYATGYTAATCIKSIAADMIPKIEEIIRPVVEAVQKIAQACAAGIEAFGRAYREAMSETE
jgi:hypothetical protein